MRETYILSMGGACGVSYNLRRVFKQETAYPFDWWITPLPAVTRLLTNPDLDWVYNPAVCTLVRDASGVYTSIGNRENGVLFPHDVNLTERAFEEFEKAKAKQEFLFKRLYGLDRADLRLALVRGFHEVDRHVKPEDFTAYMEACRTVFPKAKLRHFFLNYPMDVPGAVQVTAKDPPGSPWYGDAAVWDAALAEIQAILRESEAEECGSPASAENPS